MQAKFYYKDQTIFEGKTSDAPHHKDSSKIFHREDGPAAEWSDGTKFWYQNGELHRENEPAVEWDDIGREWYQNGMLHRENGPAVERPDGDKEWWLGHEEYTQDEFNKTLKEVDSLDSTVGLLDPREWARNRWKRKMKELNNAS